MAKRHPSHFESCLDKKKPRLVAFCFCPEQDSGSAAGSVDGETPSLSLRILSGQKKSHV
jgi:hypothetical protein